MPKGLDALIIALRDSHKGAKNLADKLEKLNENQEVPDEILTHLKRWEREAETDKSRKIAREIARSIHEYALE